MKVVHLAKTPTAGSPIRIVTALNAHSGVQARLVVGNPNHYGARIFDGDLGWEEDREEALAEIDAADIIHIHRFMDFRDRPFGLDFDDLSRRGKALIRQFHANPHVMADRFGWPVGHIVDDPVPQLVIGQFHERFYPRARVVPNLVPLEDERYTPAEKPGNPVIVFFAPSETTRSAWDSRWETKAYPETQDLLGRIARDSGEVEMDVRTETPFNECLEARRRSHIAIDELATGSYHLSSLESLGQGVPTMAYLDQRTQWTIGELTGAEALPWINVHLEEAEKALRVLINDADLREETGRRSREWMLKYWNDREMVQHYVRAYEDLLEHPDRFDVPRFDVSSERDMWLARGRDDATWDTRCARHAHATSAVKD
jgi:hypothetical protein